MSFKLDSKLKLGYVHLRVIDLEAMKQFYATFGFEKVQEDAKSSTFAIPGNKEPILVLTAEDSTIPRPRRTTGLFHFAILVKNREDLAHVIGNISKAGIPISGAGDHIYSEAFYLNDPEGNGIEIYQDRPRSEWLDDGNGGWVTATNPVDVDGVMALFDANRPWRGFPEGTILGHMHLNISELDEATTHFYINALGFDVMTNFMESALFISAGRYHHHIAINIWQGRGIPNSPAQSSGLEGYSLILSSEDELKKLAANLTAHNIPFISENQKLIVRDPNEDQMIFTVE